MKDLRILVLSISLVVLLTACTPEDNFTGSEYMPDMAHSLAVEANTYNYYYYNTWDKESTIELAKLVYPRVTPAGTVPRGYASAYLTGGAGSLSNDDAETLRGSYTGSDNLNAISVPTNGHVPYYYDDSVDGRLAAIAEVTDNPFPITDAGMDRAKFLYETFCGICHGNKGNGLGYLYNDEENKNAKYLLAPANFLSDEFKAASNGRYYHAIMYGYNAMGAYKDKISFEERWQVIHYIRGLQATEGGSKYNEEENTLNAGHGTILADFKGRGSAHGMHATDHEEGMEAMHHDGDHSEEAHGADLSGTSKKKK
jgi:mono/diheme cytochrome c family protein